MSDESERFLKVHYVNGASQTFRFPPQARDDEAVSRIEDILKSSVLMAEVEGQLVVIPLANVLRLEVSPAPATLPSYAGRHFTLVA